MSESHATNTHSYRVSEALAAHARGWALTPLDGKVPRLDQWNKRPFPSAADVAEWAAKWNVGLRTGAASGGIVVVDEDTAKGGCIEVQGDLPPTVTVLTGGGGKHFYFRMEPGSEFRNTANKIGPFIDTRGEGGQVVFPGSIHPDTGMEYAWAPGLSPDEVEIATVPSWVMDVVRPRERVRHEAADAPDAQPASPRPSERYQGLSAYLEKALHAEVASVRNAPEGARNDSLNRAAFNLGQLVAGGALPEMVVLGELESAALSSGLTEAETRKTISSAFRAALESPRTIPTPITRRSPVTSHEAPQEAAEEAAVTIEVLLPGAHVDAGGEYFEIGNHDFVEAVVASLPDGLVYRRMGCAGQLVGDRGELRFLDLNANRLRVLMDRHLRLVKWVKRKGDSVSVKVYQNASHDHAGLVLDFAGSCSRVRELKHLTQYPVFLGDDFTLCAPGWNAAGVYYDEPEDIEGLDRNMAPDLINAVLSDLVVDFPFKTEASRHNFFGLLLTPLLRPALRGNTPLHLIQSPLERTGKSKLAGDVFGTIITGRQTSTIQMSGTDDEIDKRILGLLRKGDTLVHIDNVRDYIDSAALASLLTSPEYSGRVLGKSEITTVPNNITLVATGNNVKATGEIVKRTMPIVLQPSTDSPEERNDFRHPDLIAYLTQVRPQVLTALLSSVRLWSEGSRVMASPPMGGFERWSQVVGGIMQVIGFTEWRGNYKLWVRSSDPNGEDLRNLVDEWFRVRGIANVTSAELLAIAEELQVFPQALKSQTERGRMIALSRTVLSRHLDAPVGDFIIRAQGSGNNRAFYLEQRNG